MTAKPNPFKLVADTPIDLTLAMRAEILARDWSAVHVAADKRKPLPFFDRIVRTWRA